MTKKILWAVVLSLILALVFYLFLYPSDYKVTFFSETSIEDLRHYAEDAGASDEDIAAIVSPKVSYNFEADGVLISQ